MDGKQIGVALVRSHANKATVQIANYLAVVTVYLYGRSHSGHKVETQGAHIDQVSSIQNITY